MHDDDWFTLAELTGRLGGLVWVEDQVATVVDSWTAVDAHEPSVVLFHSTSRHHRWHSEVIRDCLATSPQLRETDVVQAPTPGWAAAIATLGELADPDATVARLKSLVKVVNPWIERETGALLDLARPVSDAATSRWLRFVSIDHRDDDDAATELLATRASAAVRFDDHLAINDLHLD